MDAALTSLQQSGDREFLRLTHTALKIIQNVLSEPHEEKYRRLRIASKYVSKPGVPELLRAIGFEKEEEYYLLPDPAATPELLLEWKSQLVVSRKAIGSILGWEVPPSALQFSQLLGAGRYGDIFQGRMDGREVAVKTRRPDGAQKARDAFDRELELLCKLSHPHVVKLYAVTLTSDPASLVLEYVPQCLLGVLHRGELADPEVVRYARQTAAALEYLHSQDVIHCDLAARNIRLDSAGMVRVCDFGLSRRDGSPCCRLTPSQEGALAVRWTAPDVLKLLFISKHADVWSFGVLLYELVSGGSVPYASFSNTEVKAKVLEGYRLPQPQGCPDELYALMLTCWAQRPTERPHFPELLRNHLEPLEAKLASGEGKLSRQISEDTSSADSKGSQSRGRKSSKVKELSYQSVEGKGGGLVRVYTALVSPFHYRIVVVCSRKTTLAEVVQTALAKCGKTELDAKSHSIALVTPGNPTRYLDPEDRVLSVKAGAPPTSMFVLCVHMPGIALLEVMNSLRQNPAYGSAFAARTCGYLVLREGGGVGTLPRVKGQRLWCVLDGSTLLCYRDEEDEGVKQFERYLDFKGCSIALASVKKGHHFTVSTNSCANFTFTATDKADLLQWIEAMEAAAPLDASTLLLQASGGAVVQTGFVDCQEFAYETSGVSPLQPIVERRLGSHSDFAGTYAAVDHGKHWTVLKSSGLFQCLLEGRPETLFSLTECKRVKVHNPKEMKECEDYSIEVESPETRFVLQAVLPSEHFDWVLSIERILRDHKRERILRGHRNRESGYVNLKRLLMQRKHPGELYSLPKCFDDMVDMYEAPSPPPEQQPPPPPPPGGATGTKRSTLLQSPLAEENSVPLPPRDYLPPPLPSRDDVAPPPLPPRDDAPPPLPPKGKSLPSPSSSSHMHAHSVGSNTSNGSDTLDDEYVLMQPNQSRSAPSPRHRPLATTPTGSGPVSRLSRSPSQPITIPNRRSSKRSALLRTDSESSSITGSTPPELQQHAEWVGHTPRSRNTSMSSLHSLPRDLSSHSLSSYHRQLSTELSAGSLNSTPPLPHRNGERSSGYSSPMGMSPSPGLHRSQSQRVHHYGPRIKTALPEDTSCSDGMMVKEAQQQLHPISTARSVACSFGSDGYCSNSSEDEERRLPPGWKRGYFEDGSRCFYFNSETGVSTWSLQEVLLQCQSTRQSPDASPGDGWRLVRTDDGRVYYYHERTRRTTWDVQDTWA